jgi:hypothetical protein
MSGVSNNLVERVLRAYADVCTPTAAANLVVAPFSELEVFPPRGGYDGSAGLIDTAPPPNVSALQGDSMPMRERLVIRATPAVERLAKLDALHAEEVLIRHSWVLVVGTIEVDGAPRKVLQPLLSRPARLVRRSLLQRVVGATDELDNGAAFALAYLGDAQMTQRIDDPDARADLLNRAAFGRGSLRRSTSDALVERMPELTDWIRTAAAAADLRISKVVAPTHDPEEWIARPGLVAIPTHTLHTSRQVSATSLRATLLSWSRRGGIDRTALAEIVDPQSDEDDDRPGVGEIESPVLLSPSQRAVVLRARARPVSVVSGAPGTGKTHALCAVAEDAVARGESVLIATQSRHAAEVVGELLDRNPGPTPVRFGDGTGMAGLIDELVERSTRPVADEEVRRRDLDLDLARAQLEARRAPIAAALQLEADAQDAPRWLPALPTLMADAPGVFDPDSDLDGLAVLLAAATPAPGDRWWSRRRRRRHQRRLVRAAGAPEDTALSRIDNALRAARARRAAATLDAHGGSDVGDQWDDLAAAAALWREALGRRRQLAPYEPRALGAGSRAAIGELVNALRAGRGRRRELLAAMQPGELTSAAPLWLGTLTDIEDVLPAAPALFDLVILDEASQIDQPRAAPALLRARRAVVVGDPHQLRHVSFRSDEEVDRALHTHGLGDRRGRLDVRRSSAFDLAATAAPVDHLREHFRSVPHLIEFSVRTFYRDRVVVMTRHPRNEVLDAIDVVTIEGRSAGRHDRNAAEVRRVIAEIRSLQAGGWSGIGVITPFRDQADALEHAVLEEFNAAELAELDLRVGTVHSFQGGERDVVVVSLGLGAGDPPGRRRFAEQRDLFNVMVTRARRRVIVVTELTASGTGLIDEYLRYAAHPLPPPAPAEGAMRQPAVTQWRDDLARELGRYHPTRTDYPVGPWSLDLCLGDGDDARAIDCGVHPDGVDAHIERRLTLMGLGWRCEDAFASRWASNAARAALELR